MPQFSKYSFLWGDGNVVNFFWDRPASTAADYTLADNSVLHGMLFQNGFPNGSVGKLLGIASARFRSLRSGLESFLVDQPGAALKVRGTSDAVAVAFGSAEINVGGASGGFANAFDINSAVRHSVYFAYLARSAGYTNFTAPGSVTPTISNTEADPTPSLYTGVYRQDDGQLDTYVLGNLRYTLTAGVHRWLANTGTRIAAFDQGGLYVATSSSTNAAITSDGGLALFHNNNGVAVVNALGNGSFGVFQGWASEGTSTNQTALGSFAPIVAIDGRAFNGTDYQRTARMTFRTSVAQTTNAAGSQIEFETTPNGSTAASRAVAVRIKNDKD
jgi:hypothetical protein